MAENYKKTERKKLKSSYLSSVISITLVLFILGLLSIVLLDAKLISNYSKENIRLLVIFNDNIPEEIIMDFQKKLNKMEYVKATEYITKEKAALDLKEQIGEDFLEFLGENPLPYSMNVFLKTEFANAESISKLEKELLTNNIVKEITYQKSLISLMNENIRKISLFLLGFGVLMLIISISLINNTIRLSVYSSRFIIRSMQLVGATKGFIRKPFLIRALVQGLIGSFLAMGLLAAILYFAEIYIPELKELQDIKMFAFLFGIEILLSISITGISTYFAVRKYLNLKTDNLYYY